jgi:hypothetical protein
MNDRAHNFTRANEVIFCTLCGHIAMDFRHSSESQANVDAQRVAKQPCPRTNPNPPVPAKP